ncbi:hypothetical protein PIB30_109579, partial [Stylosanthes scabra]|nr:hypothetical protein [Stylosanthes scabra]
LGFSILNAPTASRVFRILRKSSHGAQPRSIQFRVQASSSVSVSLGTKFQGRFCRRELFGGEAFEGRVVTLEAERRSWRTACCGGIE